MLRRFLAMSIALTLILSTVACTAAVNEDAATNLPPTEQPAPGGAEPTAQTNLSDGQYPVQQASYDDSTGEYSVLLLNTAPSEQPFFVTPNLQMARLTEEEIAAGEQSYLKVEQGQPSLHLTPEFRIEYIHNVTETQVNPQTGQEEVVIVRQEPSFWTPFAGALAGQALGSLLFRPQYYFPPVYQPGVILTGYGGYGSTYNQAASRYQSRYQAPPVEVRNRQLRTTGRLRTPAGANVRRPNVNRPSGSGFGSSTLRRDRNTQQRRVRTPGGSFGSGGRSRSFGGRRRR